MDTLLGAYDVAVAIALLTFGTLKLISPIKPEGPGPEEKKSDT